MARAFWWLSRHVTVNRGAVLAGVLALGPAAINMAEEPPSGSEEANGPPRLMITKIVCENFKSYAGTKVLGPFHKVGCFLVKYPEVGGDYTVPFVSFLSVLHVHCWS